MFSHYPMEPSPIEHVMMLGRGEVYSRCPIIYEYVASYERHIDIA